LEDVFKAVDLAVIQQERIELRKVIIAVHSFILGGMFGVPVVVASDLSSVLKVGNFSAKAPEPH
jgi:hypothetical protein